MLPNAYSFASASAPRVAHLRAFYKSIKASVPAESGRLRGPEIAAEWALIPEDVQVLITHGPPHGILDAVERLKGKHAGCEALRDRILALSELRLHAFGHIHEGYGQFEQDARRYVNACVCDFNYAPVNAPVVVDLD
jgi:Icc-related predicted phosphoesterase